MSESPSRLIKTADPTQPAVPQHKISGKVAPVRIFQKDWMEALTLISFKTFLIFCSVFEGIVFLITLRNNTNSLYTLLYTIAGIPIWLVTEYVLHRFVFHFRSNNKKIQRLIYIFHGNHHIQPNHPYRTLMPIIVTLPVGLLIWFLFSLSLGLGRGSALFLGFYAGYTFYDCMHFATHNFRMKRFPLSLWKKHHLFHHYRTEEHNYSISFPWLDRLFRTHFKS
ncbi:sterol desaturase family protein [Parasaccharibacter apium]|uniref:sterol desaturase family protein n=1 Tax=Parasaccharibacter apium TaxID=1510841 RepID=UPI0009DD420D|nr:sterol desaturase family protein [Parasaccharibacter apium]